MCNNEKIHEVLSQHGYELKSFIGKGSFSSVYICKSKKYNKNFAIKIAVKHKKTELEYNMMISLNHPNIIGLYDYFTDDSAHYLVMDYCSNKTLFQKGSLSYDKFVYYAKQTLEAVAFCHSKHIAHRDIKPENIFIDQYDHIKLADFGMAKKYENEGKSTEKCGSLLYFAPEMIQYPEFDPFKADIWALGVTFFYMATGIVPFKCDTREGIKEKILYTELEFDHYNVNLQIRFLIKKMTERNVEHRYCAEKLLKLPIFSSTIPKNAVKTLNMKIKDYLPIRKISYNFSSACLWTFDDNAIEDNDVEKIVQPKMLHSYKSFISNPSIHKFNLHFDSIKPI